MYFGLDLDHFKVLKAFGVACLPDVLFKRQEFMAFASIEDDTLVYLDTKSNRMLSCLPFR